MKNQKSVINRKTIILIFDIIIIILCIGVLIITYTEYQSLNRISCIGLSAPPKYFVVTSLITRIAILIQLPILLIVIKFLIIKNIKK
jgi:hypothetical protein